MKAKTHAVSRKSRATNGALRRSSPEARPTPLRVAYDTARGRMLQGSAEQLLVSALVRQYRKRVQLIFTSPPFPLNHKKRYGNLRGHDYLRWLTGFAPLFRELLTDDGSIVLELGNAWEPGQPVMSTLALEALLAFKEAGRFFLCQQFVCHNPARLPSPAQWVNVERIRVKDAFTHLWWLAPCRRPKADNRRVLRPYSASMRQLLDSRKYNGGRTRPSGHNIGRKSFFTDHGGAIPPNVLMLPNTVNSEPYLAYCKAHGKQLHPARMPIGLPEFFINFLTVPRNLVLDPFAGSNTTGAAAEILKRRWLSIELNPDYILASRGRFAGITPVRTSRRWRNAVSSVRG